MLTPATTTDSVIFAICETCNYLFINPIILESFKPFDLEAFRGMHTRAAEAENRSIRDNKKTEKCVINCQNSFLQFFRLSLRLHECSVRDVHIV